MSNTIATGIIRIYCDFDGTIVREDVGDKFFEHFSGPEMWADNKLYCDGEIPSDELYRRNIARIGAISQQDVDAFCAEYSVDPTFVTFTGWAEEQGFPLMIVSDGFDAYIEPLLARAGLAVPYVANAFRITADGKPKVAFPHRYPDCTCSANCKRNHVLLNSADEDYIVYVGDGRSDFCPARYSDLVFARGTLETYCQEDNISFRRFDSFDDVRNVIETLTAKKRLRKPKRAELLRKSVWMSG